MGHKTFTASQTGDDVFRALLTDRCDVFCPLGGIGRHPEGLCYLPRHRKCLSPCV